eukprot:CAMPEP_0172447510 /NCGR_PEP_ID=MMETSP1065-20121228/6810_1 /TAXON_ID=265537 /ORGANISM="Amphiprora paludosa, Strain CCMP125" /LENGTH=597 /DNA_ID=CAMNT_0013198831 /DNA_START=47 /DNA_END=1840 /DNA_ORIENTATION=-
MPRFQQQEITVGRVLGRGAFNVVQQVQHISLQPFPGTPSAMEQPLPVTTTHNNPQEDHDGFGDETNRGNRMEQQQHDGIFFQSKSSFRGRAPFTLSGSVAKVNPFLVQNTAQQDDEQYLQWKHYNLHETPSTDTKTTTTSSSSSSNQQHIPSPIDVEHFAPAYPGTRSNNMNANMGTEHQPLSSQHRHDSHCVDIYQDRVFMARQFSSRSGGGNHHSYVIKSIHRQAALDRNDSQLYIKSVMDLVMEAKFLTVLQHTNIISMRAMALTSPFTVDPVDGKYHFFIVLDQLQPETLSMRLNTTWKARLQQVSLTPALTASHTSSLPTAGTKSSRLYTSLFCRRRKPQRRLVPSWRGSASKSPNSSNSNTLGSSNNNSNKKHQFWLERLRVAWQISNALAYLHSQRVAYRDLKPMNVGFALPKKASNLDGDEAAVMETVKLFDFGLAMELNPKEQYPNGTYRHDALFVGSMRYMAPELALSKPYNESCDVYSFGILLWQILAVEKPLEIYAHNRDLFGTKVFHKGVRPQPAAWWPRELKTLLRSAWDANMFARPTMEQVSNTLQDVLFQEMGYCHESEGVVAVGPLGMAPPEPLELQVLG